MPRQLRIIDPTGAYHLTDRGNNKQQTFYDYEDYRKLLSLFEIMQEKHGFLIYHYTLMPNHWHFLIRLTGKNILSECMQLINSLYAQYFLKKYQRTGHFWQGRFKSKHVDRDEYLSVAGKYIEMNPVRAGIVEKPEDWPHSSYRFYAFGEQNSLVDPSPLYTRIHRDPAIRQAVYRALMPTKKGKRKIEWSFTQ